ncbi:MAG: 2,4-dihydroxyhept-2-ene-1,7-dioic acid aldolase [Cohaesibacteraceae bacterium]|nr:2,4-dihydroxyhept-2-ene-1,7-dioic acid aldolase [Cohaesibacteraceae bacterium]
MSSLQLLSDKLRSGSQLLCGWMSLPDPLVAELIASSSLEGVLLDMQHGQLDYNDTVLCGGAIIARNKPLLVRIPVGEYAMASRMLDMGATGIVAPMINGVADARALVDHCKYPPIGQRSWAPVLSMARHGIDDAQEMLALGNECCMAFAMIETRTAFDVLEDILNVEGLDGVFVGPADLSIALNGGTAVDPLSEATMEVVAGIADTVKKSGKLSGIYAAHASAASRYRKMGFNFVTMGSDVAYLRTGLSSMINAVE